MSRDVSSVASGRSASGGVLRCDATPARVSADGSTSGVGNVAAHGEGFLPYNLDPRLLLSPDTRAWLLEGHLALFVSDVVDELDLSEIYAAYD